MSCSVFRVIATKATFAKTSIIEGREVLPLHQRKTFWKHLYPE
jgi:hypothetical protein